MIRIAIISEDTNEISCILYYFVYVISIFRRKEEMVGNYVQY